MLSADLCPVSVAEPRLSPEASSAGVTERMLSAEMSSVSVAERMLSAEMSSVLMELEKGGACYEPQLRDGQRGSDRVEYGRQFFATLSDRLQHLGIRAGSPTRSRLFRAFHQQYRRIRPTLSDESAMPLHPEDQLGIQPTASDFQWTAAIHGRLAEGAIIKPGAKRGTRYHLKE